MNLTGLPPHDTWWVSFKTYAMLHAKDSLLDRLLAEHQITVRPDVYFPDRRDCAYLFNGSEWTGTIIQFVD